MLISIKNIEIMEGDVQKLFYPFSYSDGVMFTFNSVLETDDKLYHDICNNTIEINVPINLPEEPKKSRYTAPEPKRSSYTKTREFDLPFGFLKKDTGISAGRKPSQPTRISKQRVSASISSNQGISSRVSQQRVATQSLMKMSRYTGPP